jgi:hypothetical protein
MKHVAGSCGNGHELMLTNNAFSQQQQHDIQNVQNEYFKQFLTEQRKGKDYIRSLISIL